MIFSLDWLETKIFRAYINSGGAAFRKWIYSESCAFFLQPHLYTHRTVSNWPQGEKKRDAGDGRWIQAHRRRRQLRRGTRERKTHADVVRSSIWNNIEESISLWRFKNRWVCPRGVLYTHAFSRYAPLRPSCKLTLNPSSGCVFVSNFSCSGNRTKKMLNWRKCQFYKNDLLHWKLTLEMIV